MDPNNRWQTPSIPDEGDADPTTLYTAVGRALSYWEVFEGNLGLLYVQFISPGMESDAARASYGSLVAFGARLSMLQSAGRVYFREHPHAAMETAFGDLARIASKAGAQRNRIAHGVVQPHPRRNPDRIAGHTLVPGFYATNRRDQDFKPDYAFHSEIIDRFGIQFRDLADPAFKIVAQILTTHRRLPK